VAKRPTTPLTPASSAKILEDDRDSASSPVEKETKDQYAGLTAWVVATTDTWRDWRRANYEPQWDEYERHWRAIYDPQDKQRKSERSKLMTPALSEAVENCVAEIEEGVFGRGDFFDFKAEANDDDTRRNALAANKTNLKEDLGRDDADFVPNTGEALINGAVYGSGIGEIVMVKHVEREIVPEMDPATGKVLGATTVARDVECAVLRSVHPRNFLIDPNAKTINGGLGCAVEEYVGAHEIAAGQENETYRDVDYDLAGGDADLTPDPLVKTEFIGDKVHCIRYYGLVPEHLLYPKAADEEFASLSDEKPDDERPGSKMVEAIVVIANKCVALKAVSTPFLMKDRPLVDFPWDIVPGRFWGRSVCEKGLTPQKALDAELRSRLDALAYAAAPMMGMDGSRLPRGFKLEVFPGKSILTNGDPATILRPFKFGELDQNTWQQAQALDQMVQRATGSLDVTAMAQRGGDARTGAMSMSLSGVVKRSKRTLINFLGRFFIPSLRKILWRNMQFYPERYAPINSSFVATNTTGIMQREYETMTLTQLLASMEPGSKEYKILLIGVIANTGLKNREQLIQMVQESIVKQEQAEAAAQQAALAAQQPPVADPMQAQLATVMVQLQIAQAQRELAKTEAETAEIQSRAMLNQAKFQTELVQPQIQTAEVAMKGIYNTPEEQMQAEFDRRLGLAELMETKADRESNERIAQMQTQASVMTTAIQAQADVASTQPAPLGSANPGDVMVARANAEEAAANAVREKHKVQGAAVKALSTD
jgi:hypothetical protein